MKMRNVEDIYPLSPAQMGLLFHTIQEPDSGVYFEQYSCVLSGMLDIPDFRRAWQKVVERHPVLRTIFIWEGIDQPLQVVRQQVDIPCRLQDWQGLSELEQQARLEDFLQSDRTSGFDLSKAPLMRLSLIKIAPTAHRMVWSFHHLLFDGWSTPIILKEVFAFYEAFRRGQVLAIGKPKPFRAYIAWLNQQDFSKAETFWKRELEGFTTPTSLNVNTSSGQISPPASGYGEQKLALSEAATVALKKLAVTYRLTQNTLVQGAWAILLSRYSGEQHILFGATVSGRSADLPAVEEIVGMFINTLPVRVEVPSEGNLLDWLKTLQRHQLQIRQYEHTPLVDIQGWSAIPRGRALFDSIVVFENYPADGSWFQANNRTVIASDIRYLEQSNYPLSLLAIPASRLQLHIIYNRQQFDDATIVRMLGHLETVLGSIANNPAQQLSEVQLLAKAERHQILIEWNETSIDYPRNVCIHHLIEAQADQKPEAVAVEFAGKTLTYDELNVRANQLASYLQQAGVGPNVLVGIAMERSLEMIVAILGVLKAGGAYLPLDPSYPKERLAFLLADAGAAVLLTREELVDRLLVSEATTICLDTDWTAIARESETAPDSSVTDRDLVYVIYTSGSTGKPKGVLVTHRNLVHSTVARFHYYPEPVEKFLLLSSFTFDSSIVGIFWTLCQGGTLVLPPQRIEQDIHRLATIIETNRITHVLSLPTLHGILLEQAKPVQLNSLRTVIVAGEACHYRLVRHHYDCLPQATLYNEYGPTECTVWSTVFQVPTDFESKLVPIGRPGPNMQNYVLDRNRQPVPIAVPGELYIGGDGLAQGYLNQPGLTAEKFIKHPFSPQPGARLYRTGDLARYLPDGNIEFLGRADHQVKIRGFRIEPGEIEAVLDQHPVVRLSVVMVRDAPARSYGSDQPPGPSRRLVAYVEAVEGRPATANELRRFLQGRLPEYMVPAAYAFLEAMPLSPNGKVDRNRLPEPDPGLFGSEDAFVAPRTQLEQSLADIWADVLGIKQVGIHNNFFELGGDSILSIQIIAKANRAGIRLKPNHIFQRPTIAALATVAEYGPTTIMADQAVVTGPVGLTPVQHWFFEQNLSQPHHWNQSYLLELSADVDLMLLRQSIQQLLLQHDALRLSFKRGEAGWEQTNIGTGSSIPIAHFDLAEKSIDEQEAALVAAATELQATLILSEGVLVRVGIFELGDDRPRLMQIVIHHLAVDGISWRILFEDLENCYQQLQESGRIQLPAKTTSFQQWAERLNDYAQTAEVKQELSYWLTQFDAWDVRLPLDYPDGREANTVESSEMVVVALSEEETKSLLHDVPQAYRTQINDVLLTALLLACSRWLETGSLLFDLEGHGRETLFDDTDLSRTVGWFTTIYPVLLRCEASPDIGSTLASVKEQLRGIPNRGIGYGLLRYLNRNPEIERSLTKLPQPELTFNYMGQFDHALSEYSLFSLAGQPDGPARSCRDNRQYLLDINGLIEHDRLTVYWAYSRNCYREDTIEQIAQDFISSLRAIVAHCLSPTAGAYTSSDFPLAKLDYDQLERLTTQVSQIGRTVGVGAATRNIEDIYPLTPMQELMLLHALAKPNEDVLFTQLRFALRGDIDAAVLAKTWQIIVARHSALRTAFYWDDENAPLQIVWQRAVVPFEHLDLRGLSPEEQQARLLERLQMDSTRGFDLARPPLIQLTFIQLADDRFELVWNSHHLVMDRWCITIILQEMFALFASLLRGDQVADLPAPRPFGDYITWLKQQDLRQAERFWRQKLAGFTAPTLVAAGSRSNKPTISINDLREHKVQIPTEIVRNLRDVTRYNQLTLNTMLQGAWALLLSRYKEADDVLFGVTVSGRPADLAGIETVVGSFINNLPVRVQMSRTNSLLTWLQDFQDQQLAMQPYGYVSPAHVQSWSELSSRTPLFDTLLILQTALNVKPNFDSSFAIVDVKGELTTTYPLTISSVEEDGQLQLWASYDSSCLDADFVEKVFNDLTTVLRAMVDDPFQGLENLLRSLDLGPLETAPNDTNLERRPGPAESNRRVSRGELPAAASRTWIERDLVGLWEKVLGLQPVGLQDNFFDLGGTSLQAMHLFSQIEASFGVSLPLVSLIKDGTVAGLARVISRDEAEISWSPVVKIQPEGSMPPFYCIHGLTGDILWFRKLGECLAPEQPLFGIQARGLDGVLEPIAEIEEMATFYIEEMQKLQPVGPYYIGGASFGGTVAYEMAQQLLVKGEQVGLLVMLDHVPPTASLVNAPSKVTGQIQSGARIIRNLPHWFGSFVQLGMGPIAARVRRKARVATKEVNRKLGRSNGNLANIDAADLLDYGSELPYFRQRLIEAHFRAIEDYVAKPYPGRVTLFQARAQPLLKTTDPLTGWQNLEIGELDFSIVAGSHEGMFKESNVRGLAKLLRKRIIAVDHNFGSTRTGSKTNNDQR